MIGVSVPLSDGDAWMRSADPLNSEITALDWYEARCDGMKLSFRYVLKILLYVEQVWMLAKEHLQTLLAALPAMTRCDLLAIALPSWKSRSGSILDVDI